MSPAATLEPALSMEETAAACGLSLERFRRVWPGWVKAYAFPRPFKRPQHGRGKYGWRAEAVAAWRRAREAALGGAEAVPEPANDAPPARRHAGQAGASQAGAGARVHRQRLDAAARMKGLA